MICLLDDIYPIISDTLDADAATLRSLPFDYPLTNLGLNSLTSVQIIIKLEEKFALSIEESDLNIENISTIEKVLLLLGKYMKNSSDYLEEGENGNKEFFVSAQ